MEQLDRAAHALRQSRAFALALTDDLSEADLLRIPEGWRNNALWHLGHLVVTLPLLTRGLAGLDLKVPKSLVAGCRKGTSPEVWEVPPDLGIIRQLLVEQPGHLLVDYAAGRFSDFQTYTTSTGAVLDSVEAAVHFNNVHEGIHVGQLLRLRRALGVGAPSAA
jgi:hypothetical protein